MNGYLFVTIVSFIVTIVSLMIEHAHPIIDSEDCDGISNFVYRFLHFLIFFYLPSFLLFFKYNSFDAYIYLGLVLLLFTTWYLFECCILTYYEIKTYKIDHNKYDTTFHPTMKSIFRDYSDLVMTLFGILITFNVGYIIYNNKKIPIVGKILYSLIYVLLLGDSVLKSRGGEKQYYPKKGESFFVKFIHTQTMVNDSSSRTATAR